MKLVTMMAKACHYAQEHIDDDEAWSQEISFRETALQCVSYQMACFFAQNTNLGYSSVDYDVVLDDLVEHDAKSEQQWEEILENIAKELGGWK